MSFRIHRRDTELRFVAKFGKKKSAVAKFPKGRLDYHTEKKLGLRGNCPSPILPKMGWSPPKLSERCHPLTCPRIPNLARIGCVLPHLFRKDWLFGPKSQYN